jgi:hypothetical protein
LKNGIAIFALTLAAGAGLAVGFRSLQGTEGGAVVQERGNVRPTVGPEVATVEVSDGGSSGEVFPAASDDCIERNNRATRLLADGQLREATELFRSCVEELPGHKTYVGNLCEALIRLSRFEVDQNYDLVRGIELLGEALALETEREDRAALGQLLERWKAEWDVSKDDLVESSLFFELIYDPSRDDLLYRSHEVLGLLDQAYVELTEWFLVDPVRTNNRKLRVSFYNGEEFDRITGLGDWAGGVFDGTIRLSVEVLDLESERWSRVARHELVHAFILALGGQDVPGWLNEGLAQWLDYSSFENSRRASQVSIAKERLSGGELFRFSDLQGSLASWTDQDAITRAYAQSLATVAFIDGYYGRDALLAMVEGSSEEGGVVAAFRNRTSVDLETVLVDLAGELSR